MKPLRQLLYAYGYMGVRGVSEPDRLKEACSMLRSPIFRYTHILTEAEEGDLYGVA